MRFGEQDMKRKKSWYKRHYVFIMLLSFGVAFVLSFWGFCIYYIEKGFFDFNFENARIVFFKPLFSTIKMFCMVFDVTYEETLLAESNGVMTNAYYMLGISRILAFFVSGTAKRIG